MAVEQAVTSQGITVYAEHIPNAHTVNLSAYIGVGSIHEQPGEEGLAHVLEHAVHLETEMFEDKKQLTEYRGINAMWANAHTNYRHTAYEASGPDVEPLFRQMGEIVTRPLFPDGPVAAEMEIVRQEVRKRWDSHSLVDYLATDFTLFGGPYGRDIAGHVEDLNFTPEQVRAFYERYYYSANTKVLAIGNITLDEAVRYTEEHFTQIDGNFEPQVQPAGPRMSKDTRTGLILDAKSTAISRLTAMTPDELEAYLADEDVYDIAGAVLSAHALHYLRNDLGISYSAAMGVEAYNAQSKVALRTSVGPQSIAKAGEAFENIVSRPVAAYSSQEILAQIGKFRGDALRSMDSLDKRTRIQEISLRTTGKPQDTADRAQKLRIITETQVREKMDHLLEIINTGPVLTHLSGSKEAVGEVDQLIQLSDII